MKNKCKCKLRKSKFDEAFKTFNQSLSSNIEEDGECACDAGVSSNVSMDANINATPNTEIDLSKDTNSKKAGVDTSALSVFNEFPPYYALQRGHKAVPRYKRKLK